MLRPWPAEDGALVRVRLVGGAITADQLRALSAVATTYGDGDLHLTGRANLQLRALPTQGSAVDGGLPDDVVAAIEATGLLPSRTHELVRNVMTSPFSGLTGGRADVRPVVAELDRRLLADPALAGLPGRFLFVLDDGRGDLVDRPADLGLVALDATTAQLRVGDAWSDVVPLSDAASAMTVLAQRFLDVRGPGDDAAWHVRELAEPLTEPVAADPRVPATAAPPPYDERHVAVPDGVLTPALVDRLTARADHLVVTPWHAMVVA